jgi:superoxide dismutase
MPGCNRSLGRFENYWIAAHAAAAAHAALILIVDRYEQAHQVDFEATAPKYTDATFSNINWWHLDHDFHRHGSARLPDDHEQGRPAL